MAPGIGIGIGIGRSRRAGGSPPVINSVVVDGTAGTITINLTQTGSSTVYYLVDDNATRTAAQIAAGGGLAAGNFLANSGGTSGTYDFSAVPNGAHYFHVVAKNAAGYSNVNEQSVTFTSTVWAVVGSLSGFAAPIVTGGYHIYVSNSTTYSFTVTTAGRIESEAWAGGASGGAAPAFYAAGGGGAGGHVKDTWDAVTTTYSGNIGQGGAAPTVLSQGNNGTDTTMSGTGTPASFPAKGGGGGGALTIAGGADGGSGGGPGVTGTYGSGVAGQGTNGGDRTSFNSATGGGGTATAGGGATADDQSTVGGDGLSSSITGTAKIYGTGGGSNRDAGHQDPSSGGSSNINGGGLTTPNGADGTGSGGAGGGITGVSPLAGKGGTGVLIFRIKP